MSHPRFVSLSSTEQTYCSRWSVDIVPEAKFSFENPEQPAFIEAPARIFKGSYQVGFIGAFTYFAGENTLCWHTASIGRYSSVAVNLVAGQDEHPTDFLSTHPMFQWKISRTQIEHAFHIKNAAMIHKSRELAYLKRAIRFGKIVIGNDVWIGEGVLIRRGVTIGDGAIIASRSVVSKDVPPYAIVGGTPARHLRNRFCDDMIERLLKLRWWNYDLGIFDGVDYTDIDRAASVMEDNLASGTVGLLNPPIIRIDAAGATSLCRYDPSSSQIVTCNDDEIW